MADWLRFDRDTVLRAGAGAGKTQALVTLYLHLVGGASARRRPLAPASIVAISFTDKAASELSARIRTRLIRLAAGDVSAEGELLESARVLGVTLPDAEGWDRALAQLGSAPVGTFHRLGGALLRRNSLAAAIDPAFRQLDAGEARGRLEAAAEKAILSALDRRDAAVQALIVELGFSGVGFGSGAVQKLVELHHQRAEQGLGAAGLDDNYQPAALASGWRQAATNFVAAAFRLATVPDLGPTWTSLQKKLQLAAAAWGPAHGGGADEDACRRGAEAARDLVAPAIASSARGSGCREAKEGLVAALAAVEACALGHRAAPLAAALARLLDDVSRRYAEDKRRLGALDFSDLIVRARDLLRDHAGVREAERLRCEVLLVDEFQDTNAVQAELVWLLAEGPRRHEVVVPDARLLVVGDRKQSIYEFRGADVAVFVGFEATILDRGGTRGVLGRSFRSRPSLVTLTNELFAFTFAAGSDAAPYRIAWDPVTDPLASARPDDGGPAAELIALDADRSAAMDAGQQRAAEASALAARLSQLHTAGRRDMALLLRAFTQLEVYLEALRGAGVPHFVVNGRGFFEAQEVRDLAAALRLLDDPDDRLALVTTLRSPLALVSDETLLRLQLAHQLHLEGLLGGGADAVLGAAPDPEHAEEQRRLRRLIALLGGLRPRADRLGPHAVLRALCDGTDYEVSLAGGYQGEQRVANLGALLERARALEEAGGDLRAFVRTLVELSRPDAVDPEGHAQIAAERADVVRVMTVHQSKGLEFAVVALASCGTPEPVDRGPVLYDRDGGLGFKLRTSADLQHAGPSAAIAELRRKKAQAESRRLFYVAATRAKDLLILSGERVTHEPSWRSLVDEARRRSAKVAALLPITPADSLATPKPQDQVPLPAGDAVGAARLVARAQAAPPLPPPAPITVAVTQLADFALCARRHQLLHIVGLAEHPRAARPESPDSTDVELDPLARGTLAHHLLEHADPARAGADLDDLLRAGGYDPLAPDVAEVKTNALRFLATPFSRALASQASLEIFRELPFVLAEPGNHGAPIRLRGQIDLLLVDRSSDDVTVVDYKHARAGSGDDYRFQLDAYALAARRILPAAARVIVGLAFLREADPSPSLREQDAAASERFAGRLRQLGGELAAARAGGTFPGEPVAVCRDIGCGFIPRCHRASL